MLWRLQKFLPLFFLNDNLWYHTMPAPVPLQPPRIFAAIFAGSIPKFTRCESQRAGINTPNQLKDFFGQHFPLRCIKSSPEKKGQEKF